jgi:hypothetical protein
MAEASSKFLSEIRSAIARPILPQQLQAKNAVARIERGAAPRPERAEAPVGAADQGCRNANAFRCETWAVSPTFYAHASRATIVSICQTAPEAEAARMRA